MQQRGAAASAGAPGQGVFPRGPPFVPADSPTQAKRFKVEGEAPRPQLPNFYLSPHQIQMMQYLQQNQNSLNTQQQHLLQQLQNHYRLMQQHQQQLRLQQQQQQPMQQQQMARPAYSPRQAAPFPMGAGGAAVPQQNFPRAAAPQSSPAPMQPPQQQQQQQQGYAPVQPALASPSNVSDQELQALLSQKDIAASLAEDLLKQLAQDGELDLEQPQPIVGPSAALPAPAHQTDIVQNPPSNIRIATEPTPVVAIGGPMGRMPGRGRPPGKGNRCKSRHLKFE